MIFGADYSYLNYGNTNINGEVNLSYVLQEGIEISGLHYMFAGCTNIDTVTSYNFGENTIAYTYNYTYYTYSDYKETGNIEYLTTYNYSYTFNQVNEGDLKVTNVGYVSNMCSMFENCYNLTSVDLTYFNLSDCNNMNNMFRNCYSLETIKFGHYAPSRVCSAENIFSNCYNLAYAYIPYELKDRYLNISEQTGMHTYYYLREPVDYAPHIQEVTTYSTIENKLYTTLKIGEIGALIVEDADNDGHKLEADEFRIYTGDKITDESQCIFSYPIVHKYGGTETIILNGYTSNIEHTFESCNSYALTFTLANNDKVNNEYSYVVNTYFNKDKDRYASFDLSYIYYCYENAQIAPIKTDNIRNFGAVDYFDFLTIKEKWQNVRNVATNIRKYGDDYPGYDGNNYEYPDYNLLKVIDAKTAKHHFEPLGSVDELGKVSYISANASYMYIRTGHIMPSFTYAVILDKEIKSF